MLRDGGYRQACALEPKSSLMPFHLHADRDGYRFVQHPATGTNQRVHWLMARCGLLGAVPHFEGQKTVIHHLNFNPSYNRPENLQFMGDRDHMRYHRSHAEKFTHFQSAEFEERRVQPLAAKAQTVEGHAYFARRGTKNILAYMAERPEHFRASVAGNGSAGRTT